MIKDKKILVCDDDHGILEMLELLLAEEGYTVILEPISVNALKTIDRENPDLVLLDIWMPVISGDQVLRALRDEGNRSHVPVLMYSASADGLTIATGAGADGFISKPFDLFELMDKIEQMLRESQRLGIT